LKAFVHKPFSEKYQATTEPFHVVNSVEMKGAEKYLVVSKKKFKTSYESHSYILLVRCKKLNLVK
jgi:hypothetical protein